MRNMNATGPPWVLGPVDVSSAETRNAESEGWWGPPAGETAHGARCPIVSEALSRNAARPQAHTSSVSMAKREHERTGIEFIAGRCWVIARLVVWLVVHIVMLKDTAQGSRSTSSARLWVCM